MGISPAGQALETAPRGIEKANPETLYGIFGDAQWTNKDRVSDSLLRDLNEHFSRLPLGNQAAQADILSQSYKYLIKKFPEAAFAAEEKLIALLKRDGLLQ